MRLEDLQKGDNLAIVNTVGELHQADFLEFSAEGMHVNFRGFGRLEIKWHGIRLLEHVMNPQQRQQNSFGPRYKVTLWQS